MFLPPARNLGGHKFKDDCDVKIAVMQLLITQDMDLHLQETKKLIPQHNKCLSCSNNHVQNSNREVLLNTNYSY